MIILQLPEADSKVTLVIPALYPKVSPVIMKATYKHQSRRAEEWLSENFEDGSECLFGLIEAIRETGKSNLKESISLYWCSVSYVMWWSGALDSSGYLQLYSV